MIQNFVTNYDPENQFEVLKNTYEQVDYVIDLQLNLSGINTEKINNVILAGLGGSAIGGDLISNLCKGDLRIPYMVSRNYTLPDFIDENSLVILSSYSGNTEETLSAGNDAKAKGAQVVCVTTGGKLKDFAERNNYPYILLKTGYQPRYSLYLNMFTVYKILMNLKIIPFDETLLKEVRDLLKKKSEEYSKEPNEALKIAESLIGFVPVIYSCDAITNAVGVRLKGQFNENSKVHAFHNSFPEFNHNEIIGWETFQESQLRTKVIFIEDETYHPQIKRRYQIIREIITKNSVEIIALKSNLNHFKLRLIDLVFLGDWITYYLAVLRGKDPSEIDFIHQLKKELAK